MPEKVEKFRLTKEQTKWTKGFKKLMKVRKATMQRALRAQTEADQLKQTINQLDVQGKQLLSGRPKRGTIETDLQVSR